MDMGLAPLSDNPRLTPDSQDINVLIIVVCKLIPVVMLSIPNR